MSNASFSRHSSDRVTQRAEMEINKTKSRSPRSARPGSPGRRSSRSRRRRPTYWDMKEPPYGVPMPPPGGQNPMGGPAPKASNMGPPQDSKRGHAPPPNDVVRAPRVGETGPLAGINISALRALLTPNSRNAPSSVDSVGNTAAPPAAVPSAYTSGMTAVTGEGESQVTRHARRLYVGNLPADTLDVQIEDFFNRALEASHGTEKPGNAVVSVYLNLEKRFAFIETRSVREAAAGLALDGVKFKEYSLRVRRPNDYNGNNMVEPRPPEGFKPSILGIVSTQVSDGPNKVFIGGIPYTLTEDNIKNLLQSYGQLGAFNLIKEPNSGMSKGFAFFEFEDPTAVDKCCEGLHGTQLGDKTLTVRRATHTNQSSTYASGARNTAPVQMDTLDLIREESCVVELKNVVGIEEVGNAEALEEVKLDVRDQGERFGKVEDVVVVKGIGGDGACVYIRWKDLEGAERGEACLHGRRYAGRLVTARSVGEKWFEGVRKQAV